MARYFEGYADRFALKGHITFNTTVVHARREAGAWTVTLDTGERRRYPVLIVANGHHWNPRWPEPPIPGRFDGAVLHAHDYRAPDEPVDMTGMRVVVVGAGNSAMDIAGELSRPGRAAKVYLSVRRGAWIIPKTLFGRPVDGLRVAHWFVPWRLQSLVARLMLRLFGPPRPGVTGCRDLIILPLPRILPSARRCRPISSGARSRRSRRSWGWRATASASQTVARRRPT
jgi:dimethylaniline monooxygenase (N-oxide forming)